METQNQHAAASRGIRPEQVAAARCADSSYALEPLDLRSALESPSDLLRPEASPLARSLAECVALAGLDAAHVGAQQWNPLAELVPAGGTVLVKPNFVSAFHPRSPNGWRWLITNPNLIALACALLWRGLGCKGKIILADAPHADAVFADLLSITGLQASLTLLSQLGVSVCLLDLRQEEWVSREGVIFSRTQLPGDPAGYVRFDLGASSELAAHAPSRIYYGADYDSAEVNEHHHGGKHEYLISRTAMEADVVFSMPKMKTHKKVGMTGALKNLVGVNGNKNWLPHHSAGTTAEGGDEMPSGDPRTLAGSRLATCIKQLQLRMPVAGAYLHRAAKTVGKLVFKPSSKVIRNGNWWGNDTCWRMCLDLNTILSYGNPDGTLRQPGAKSRKPHYALVDGILGGQGNGPLDADPVESGYLLFGVSAPSVDAVAAALMRLDPRKIPLIRSCFCPRPFPLAEWTLQEVAAVMGPDGGSVPILRMDASLTTRFEPHFGWKGAIEA